MHSVGESLFRSRNSVRSETDNAPRRERVSRRESEEINAQQMRASSEAECIQSKKACYEAATKPSFSRQRNRHCIRKRNNKHQKERESERAMNEVESIQ
jgi:hypothetical protein